MVLTFFKLNKLLDLLLNLRFLSDLHYVTGTSGRVIEFRPIATCICVSSCSCGEMKQVLENYHQACLMQFLMGLNETFTQVKGQILLKDPIPQIDKVFSLIRQEERQRSTGYSHNPSYESNALFCKTDASKHAANKQSYKKREKLVCTHCGLMGHTMDKCYKLHGYPPRYKTRGKGIAVNQVSVSNVR